MLKNTTALTTRGKTSCFSEANSELITTTSSLRILFANALQDYLKGEMEVFELGSLCFFLATKQEFIDLLDQDCLLKKYVCECVDIAWLSGGDFFENYKNELKSYLDSIV